MTEAPLFRATFMEVFIRYEVLPKPLRDEYMTLVGWEELSDHEVLAIFKTNRYVLYFKETARLYVILVLGE